jgi:nucleoside-diphosphate-sugar epimerase
MERVQNKKSLLILGSTGFLGSSILNLLKTEQLTGLEVLVSQSSALDEPIKFTLLNSDFLGVAEINEPNLASTLNSELIVINCASSRNSNDKDLSMHGNFVFPKKVLDTILAIQGIRIRWIQIETFWQYSKSPVPDTNYVVWKSRFGDLLTKSSVHENFLVEKLVLPHLIGPLDKESRFLPRLFSMMLKNKTLELSSPNEIFCLADVRDVAYYLVCLLSHKSIDQDLSHILFPFIEVKLHEIVLRFIEISASLSKVIFLETSDYSNPVLNLSEQPPLLRLNQKSLHDLDSTFSDIARWLSELQQFDSVKECKQIDHPRF